MLIDNFSGFFHNSLESLLVRYFMKTAKYSQLIFTSHSTNLLSNSILRPDQEYAVEFIPATGSQVRRFFKQQPRIAQNIEKMYLSGIFGGLSDYRELKFNSFFFKTIQTAPLQISFACARYSLLKIKSIF